LTKRIRGIDPPVAVDPGLAALAMVAMVERFSYYVVSRDLNVEHDEMLDTLATILHIGVFGGARRKVSRGR
jgi:hypothetical protein